MIRSPTPAAEHMRQYRKRRHRGMLCVQVRLHVTEIDSLIRKGYLKPEQKDDRNEIQAAVEAFLSDKFYEMASSNGCDDL